jgi:hypothetical protein
VRTYIVFGGGTMKKYCLFVLLAYIATGIVCAGGGVHDVRLIPDLEVQITLPPELVGEFEFPSYNNIAIKYNINHYWIMEIHENNKFLLRQTAPDYTPPTDYGYVIQEEGNYYFLPLARDSGIIREKTKITLNENGFSFLGFIQGECVAERKREITEIDASSFPDPEIQIMLPSELIGEFNHIYSEIETKKISLDWRIEIHENNKFILHYYRRRYVSDQNYGYVIQEEGDYFFLPLNKGIIDTKTKIILTENGFSFFSDIIDQEYFVER